MQVLALHPEWLGEVRRLVLTAELLALPDLARELVEAQKQSTRPSRSGGARIGSGAGAH